MARTGIVESEPAVAWFIGGPFDGDTKAVTCFVPAIRLTELPTLRQVNSCPLQHEQIKVQVHCYYSTAVRIRDEGKVVCVYRHESIREVNVLDAMLCGYRSGRR